MTGIVKIGTGAGQFFMPLIASMLITSHGWRTSYIIIGAGVLVSLIALTQLLRRNPSQIIPLPDFDNTPDCLKRKNMRNVNGHFILLPSYQTLI
jgi:MFS family permease